MIATQPMLLVLPALAAGQTLSIPPHFGLPTANPVGCTPTAAPGPLQTFTVNYNFETVERAVEGLTVTTIDEYNLLSFNMAYANTDPDTDGNHLGLAPHSYPNVAIFSENTNLANISGPARITAAYLESTIAYFHPQSFWYGCVLPSEESAGSLPTNCDITATAFDTTGKQLATQDFHFTANGSVVQFQNYGAFNPEFQQNNVYYVDFAVSNPLFTAAVIDNFIATLYQPTCAPLY